MAVQLSSCHVEREKDGNRGEKRKCESFQMQRLLENDKAVSNIHAYNDNDGAIK